MSMAKPRTVAEVKGVRVATAGGKVHYFVPHWVKGWEIYQTRHGLVVMARPFPALRAERDEKHLRMVTLCNGSSVYLPGALQDADVVTCKRCARSGIYPGWLDKAIEGDA